MTSKILSYKQLELVNALDQARDKRVWAVVDVKVKNMLPQWLQFSPEVFWLQRPEDQKTLDVYSEITEFFLKQGIQRGHTIFGIGGGATTDLAGFVAATIHRGVNWVAVPTTLMGMVDAAIGGKTAINTKLGKNLLGSFHEPEEVWICSDFLRTLPSQDLISGKGEIIKYGLLSTEINSLIMSKSMSLEELTLKCAHYKHSVVANDLLEKGERIYLNLGHTIGHALEFTLRIPHGIAIAMGIRYLLQALELKDMLNEFNHLVKKLDIDVEKIDLSNYTRFDLPAFWSTMSHDKKRDQSELKLIVLEQIGKPQVRPMSLTNLRHKLEAISVFKG